MDIKESFFCVCVYAPRALKVFQYGGDFPPLFFFFVRECRLIKVQCTLFAFISVVNENIYH